MIKWTTAVEQRNQRTLEGHTLTVESTSVAWHCAAVPPMIDSVGQMSLAVVVREADKLDFPAEVAGDDQAMLAAVPWALKMRGMRPSSDEIGGGAVETLNEVKYRMLRWVT